MTPEKQKRKPVFESRLLQKLTEFWLGLCCFAIFLAGPFTVLGWNDTVQDWAMYIFAGGCVGLAVMVCLFKIISWIKNPGSFKEDWNSITSFPPGASDGQF